MTSSPLYCHMEKTTQCCCEERCDHLVVIEEKYDVVNSTEDSFKYEGSRPGFFLTNPADSKKSHD